MSRVAFQVIADTLKENEHAIINTTTGASYDRVFELMVQAINDNELNIENSIIMNLDEYIAEREKSFTVYTYMQKRFYSLIKTKPKLIGLLDESVSDPDLEIERYNQLLRNYPANLQIVGLGVNGHLGANEPGNSFDSRFSRR
jgi:glucosamine-6-phosphate deaminase